MARARAGAGAKIRGKVEPELEPKMNHFGSATLPAPLVNRLKYLNLNFTRKIRRICAVIVSAEPTFLIG